MWISPVMDWHYDSLYHPSQLCLDLQLRKFVSTLGIYSGRGTPKNTVCKLVNGHYTFTSELTYT